MEKRGRREILLDQAARALDLPADVLTGAARVELVGNRELRVENHKGILSYGEDEILVSAGSYIIKVSGQKLELRAMTGLELLITGLITAVELT